MKILHNIKHSKKWSLGWAFRDGTHKGIIVMSETKMKKNQFWKFSNEFQIWKCEKLSVDSGNFSEICLVFMLENERLVPGNALCIFC